MKVKALADGFYKRLIKKDEEFDVPAGAKASWFAPVDQVKAGPPKDQHPKDSA